MRTRPRIAFVAVSLVAGLLSAAAPASAAPVLPSGFVDEVVTTVGAPTALAFTPDGRMLIATQGGRLRVFSGGALLATPALDLSAVVCSNSERGLLGVAVDPAFATNGWIYVFYTFNKNATCETNTASAPVNRVSRFVLPSSNVVDRTTETVLVDNMPSPAGNHNAGDLAFGKDGFLYVTIGDGGCDYAGGGCAGSNDAARDQHVLTGKVLRITRDGGIPAGNPFLGTDSSRCNVTGRTTAGRKCQETFAWGLRNPFRMAFDPNAASTRFHINDVGQNAWEEIDLGTPGADYGWNVREGFCANGSTTNCGTPPTGMTNPIFAYGHGSGCASITGGAFVPSGVWPSPYGGSYLFSDYVCGKIFRLVPASGGGWTMSEFVTGLGSSSAVHLGFGPHAGGQALYYTSYASGGQVHRIRYTGSLNRQPVASISASPTSGPAPLTVSFNGSASSDPDGDSLTYEWSFGDGTSQTTSGPTTSHTYAAGSYTASLTVRDPSGATSSPSSVSISSGNSAPTATITSPSTTVRFYVGQPLTLSGSGSDAQDGTIPSSRMSWTVVRVHGTHTHPFLGPVTGNNIGFTAPAPEDLAAAANSYLRATVTVTDSAGASTSVTRDILPYKVSLTFSTYPRGLTIRVAGVYVRGPVTYTSWRAHRIYIYAPNQGRYYFRYWTDGGARGHTITTPSSAKTYTAVYRYY
ncbi:MAG TPA: PQQ-dependent sugar dehydrogenase [Actinomycetota bacterium]|nr:PQQ-dependent sugar dehydrogenase [Actinomycetota bacterium]